MFGVGKEIEFDAGHRVSLHASKCANPHGHRYRVVLNISGALQEEGSSTGMVLDFGDIKRVLQEIHDKFDHGFIVWKDDWPMLVALGEADPETFTRVNHEAGDQNRYGWKIIVVDFHPTAENLAKWCFEYAKKRVEELDLAAWVDTCEVFETPTSVAWYPV